MPQQLTEDRRTQLDGIVSQMQANKETDDDIQAVVNDFKTKYGTLAPATPKAPVITPEELATRKAQAKATADANEPSLVGGFLRSVGENVSNAADIKQNFKNLGSAIMKSSDAPVPSLVGGTEAAGNLLLDASGAIVGGYGLAKGINAIPRTGRALENFSQLMGALKQEPLTSGLEISNIANAVTKAKALEQSGVTVPAVVKVTENALSGSSPITYEQLRGLAQTAGQKISGLARMINPPDPRMESSVGQLYGALTSGARSVASDAGMGELYDSAINEYRRAMSLRKATKAVVGAGIGAAGLGKLYSLGSAMGLY